MCQEKLKNFLYNIQKLLFIHDLIQESRDTVTLIESNKQKYFRSEECIRGVGPKRMFLLIA